MKKIKLITGLASLATLGTSLTTLASCGCTNKEIVVDIEGGSYDKAKSHIELNQESTIYLIPETGKTITGVKKVMVGNNTLTTNEYKLKKVNGTATHKLIIVKEAMTDRKIVVEVDYNQPVPTLQKIQVDKKPTKLAYETGSKLDLTGMKVNAYYSDESVVDVTDEVTTTPSKDTPLTKTMTSVIVSYEGKEASFGITVTDPTTEIIITLSVDPEKGSCNKDTITLTQPTKFSDALFGVVVTPNQDTDVFQGWEDDQGNPIDPDKVISESMTATAVIGAPLPVLETYVKYTPIYSNGKVTGYSAGWNDQATEPTSAVDIVIANEKNGFPVTEIVQSSSETSGFGLHKINKITIPENVTKINREAFVFIQTLTEVEFSPQSKLTTIETGAFAYCTSLTKINLPDTLEYVGASAFNNVNAALLTEETGPGTGEKYTYVKKNDQNANDHFILQSSSKATKIDENCHFINKLALADSVTTLTIPTTVLSIIAISGSELQEIKFNSDSQLINIDGDAFESCDKLIKINIPAQTKLLGNPFAYKLADKLTITFESGSKYKTESTGNGNLIIYDELPDENIEIIAFLSNTLGDKTYTIPNNIEIIDDFAFKGTQLTNIEVQNNNKLISIGQEAFASTSITTIDLTNWSNIPIVPEGCFFNCSEVTEIIIPTTNKIKKILPNAFNGVGSQSTPISNITIPNTIDFIGASAFQDGSITNVTFEYPEGATSASSWSLLFKAGQAPITISDFSDTAKNAKYLADYDEGYAKYTWTRIKS